MEWTEGQRKEVARQFHNVARGWTKWTALGCDDRSVLWPECMSCHRIDTVVRVEDESEPGSAPMWRCSRCEAVTPERDIWEYQTSLLLDVTERPDCSPLLLSLLERCAHMLFMTSQGKAPAANDAGNAARQAARVLDQFGVEAEWFHMADPRESILPDGFDAAVAKGMCE